MTVNWKTSDDVSDADRALQRLTLDLEDLRFENARLKTSIAERQAEIVTLSEQLGAVQARLRRVDRVTAWTSAFRRLASLRFLVRHR